MKAVWGFLMPKGGVDNDVRVDLDRQTGALVQWATSTANEWEVLVPALCVCYLKGNFNLAEWSASFGAGAERV